MQKRYRSPLKTDRRRFLRSAGVTLALPAMESLSGTAIAAGAASDSAPAKRLVCVGSNLGYYAPAFYPKETGVDYTPSPLLEHVAEHRKDFTVFSGLDHRAGNGHRNWDNFLCGKKVGSVSLDQIAAARTGEQTRIPSLQLCAGALPGNQKVSYTQEGVPLPMVNRPSVIYKKMVSTPEQRARTDYLLQSGQSALDSVHADAKRLQARVSANDRAKLEEYFTSLREMERRMHRQRQHLHAEAPEVDYVLPPYDPVAPTLMLEAEQIMFDLMAIALQTDATRVATLFIAGLGQVFTLDGVTLRAGYHALSHHGGDPDMVRDLIRVEVEHMKCLARFLHQLKTKTDASGAPLLDSTLVLFGTGMGDASRHSNANLPTIVAGGGLKHGRHLAFDRKDPNAPLLGDLYLTLLHQMGIEQKQFSTATRGMSELV